MKNLPTYDLYALLGVASHATAEDIKNAYRDAARRLHPDVNPHQGAAQQFQDIAVAYEILGSVESRRHYDEFKKRLQFTTFSSRSLTSKRVLPSLEEPQVLYLLLEIEPRTLKDEKKKRNNLNIALVLDRSASMRGVRMERVKVAAHQILEQLEAEDRIAIISFSDRADVLYPSQTVTELNSVKALINTITAGGGTEIYQGLMAGFEEVRRNFNRNMVNHIVMITDGQTFGDEHLALELADDARKEGIGISAMGIGEEWNDVFLDDLTSRTGGASAYIRKPSAVVEFLEERVRSLGDAFAERMRLTVAPDQDVSLEYVFRLMPNAQPLKYDTQPIQLGTLENKHPMKILLQFQMAAHMEIGFRTVARLDVTGDILAGTTRYEYKTISDQSIEVAVNPEPDEPPAVVLDALGKLTLYRMQQKAEEAVTQGQIAEATRRLNNLATRLLELGHSELADMARNEANRVSQTNVLSETGRKTLKFGTRLLLAPPQTGEQDSSKTRKF